jgi:hypothetical protein
MGNIIKKLWNESAPLTGGALFMLVVFAASVAGIFLDPRTITGAPAWLKPAKFAISTSIYGFTLAWLYQYITVWPRYLRTAAWAITLVMVFEVAIIDVQAARGVASHFNASTPLDRALFAVMGVAILALWVFSVGIAAALFRQKFADPVWGWTLRLGMLISVLGSASGGLMIPPHADQIAEMRAHKVPAQIGGHTVGAPDGGPGLPGVGWSKEHGDLRIPHFLGMHGIQVLAFLGWIVARRRGSVGTIVAIAASYLAIWGILVWQAFRGQSIIEPDQATLIALAIWLAATAIALIWSSRSPENGLQRKRAVA